MSMEETLRVLQTIAPLELAEEWDNVGLLVGWRFSQVRGIMTTLDVTEEALQEAIDGKADLIVTHHPMPFRPLKRVTNEDLTGKIVCKALQNGISIYSPHTAWDNAQGGINDQLASIVGLSTVEPLIPKDSSLHPGVGSARIGELHEATMTSALLSRLQNSFPAAGIRLAGNANRQVRRVAICCGSGGSLVTKAIARGADLFLTGEATYHQCLESYAANMQVVTVGHRISEAFAMETLAKRLRELLPNFVRIWTSASETVQF